MGNDRYIEVFNSDAERNEGYVYTKGNRLSCRLATQRTTDVILSVGRLSKRSVIDIGCGDGFFTIRFWDEAKPMSLVALDPAQHAIAIANRNKKDRAIEFMVGNAHSLPFANDHFDVALLQSVLHHDEMPAGIIHEAFRVAREIIIHEPNGNSPILKLIEKLSPYHREHHEKSYSTRLLRKWIEETGGTIIHQKFAGFVPMFCPDWFARLTKLIEPIVESMPLLNRFACAVQVLNARRK